jgi:outer membrane protein
LLFVASTVGAQEWLESARRIDLNDYALGVNTSVSQNPFAGASGSWLMLPYLTQLQHPAFNRNIFVLRDGDIGLRYVTDSEWEFGIAGRVQTLGLGGTDNDEIIGLEDRRWTIELGPTIGWRALPVHIGFKTYIETLGRHDGFISELAFSLPREYRWGYIVPSLEFAYLGDDYADYYYGVSAVESTPARPEYEPGAALNSSLIFRMGYRVGAGWLLTAKLGLEFLDSSITDSPIVDRDQVWSASVGLAYNANVFRPRTYDPAAGRRQSIEVRLGAFSSTVNSTIRRQREDGKVGDDISVEDLLGVPERETVMQIDTIYRLAYYHRMEASFFRLSRNATTILDRDINFGDAFFPEGSEVSTRQESETLRLQYGYSLLRDQQKEFGVLFGLHYTKFESGLSSDSPATTERISIEVPLPTLGAFGSLALGDNWSLSGDAQLFALEADRYEGNMFFGALRLERKLGRIARIGAGFNYYSTRLEGRDAALQGVYKADRYGPIVYVSALF